MSPSPAISLLVSTITTRFATSSLRTRALSRRSVVLPTPGRPRSRTLCPASMTSRTMSTVPNTARPTRSVRPMTSPARLRIAEIRCSVRSIPARLSFPNVPTRLVTCSMSSRVTNRSDSRTTRPENLASGSRPRSSTTSSSPSRSGCSSICRRVSGGSTASSRSRLSVICTWWPDYHHLSHHAFPERAPTTRTAPGPKKRQGGESARLSSR